MEYTPNLKSLQTHSVPEWYHDAKFGIFIHWGPASVPAYAPVGRGDQGEIMKKEGYKSYFRNIPYAGWYINSMRIDGCPTVKYHRNTYGSNYDYFSFAEQFKRISKNWDPEQWADLFQRAGARYCVLVTKHMDGFCMWPTRHPHYKRPGYYSERNIVRELTESVRARGLKMGYYYSSALDLSFTEKPMDDIASFYLEGGPIDNKYTQYQLNHWYELIDDYKPSVLWGDICYPPRHNVLELFANYYNRVEDGLVNDRWGQFPMFLQWFGRTRPGKMFINWCAMREVKRGNQRNPQPRHYDFSTPEYATLEYISREKWETCRGIGLSFFYNQMEPDENYLKSDELIHLLADIVSKNGNLLLNVGPMADGTIPAIQQECILGLGEWLNKNGDAIYGTKPWNKAAGETTNGIPIRYTTKHNNLYAIICGDIGQEVTIKELSIGDCDSYTILADPAVLSIKNLDGNLLLTLDRKPEKSAAYVICFKDIEK